MLASRSRASMRGGMLFCSTTSNVACSPCCAMGGMAPTIIRLSTNKIRNLLKELSLLRKITLLSVVLMMVGAFSFSSHQPVAIANQKRTDSTNNLDRVIIQNPKSSSRIAVRGMILDYTGNSITIKSAVNQTVREYPALSVVKVATSHVVPYLEGMKFYSSQRFSDAASSFEKAITQEDRKWVRREILAMLVRSALQQGDYKKASSRFIMLVESDPETFHFHLIPLQWSPSPLTNITQLDGLAWMQSKSATNRLIGASRLLLDEKYGHFATSEMKKLAANSDHRIHHLAKTQLWRLELQHPKKLTDYQLESWQKQIEAAPSQYRAGGWFLLGTAHILKRNYEQAATALLWLPLVYDTDRHLAAQCCYEGAEALLKIGKKRQAITLLEEVTQRFRKTPAAKQADLTLKKLLQP